VTLNPQQLLTFLAASIAARLPILITGAPGIGKSDVVAQAAAAAGADLIISHPAVADPTDAKGFPWPQAGEKTATFLPFGELAQALAATEPTIWFLDDLGQASPAVQASYMQLLLARRVNGHVLPDCVTFVAATNRRADRAGVSGILEPVKSRFASIVELEADVEQWSRWALSNGVDAMTVAFIRFRPELLSAFEASADLTQSPSPRTWSHASKLLALDLPQDILAVALAGAVGEGAAAERIGFERLYTSLPALEAILADPDSATIPSDPAALYAVSTMLGNAATPENFGNIRAYCQRLMDTQHGEFAALTLRDSIHKNPAVCHTADFVALVSSPLGSLMSGELS
jgi:hypothetical protein